MELAFWDISAFVVFVVFVVSISLYMSRKQRSSEDYFLAGRQLMWWLIGFSLIASNISTEHFVGQSGKGYDLGMAVASWEWMASVTLVIVAWYFVPKFLSSGIYTMPEYLEYRYNQTSRAILALLTVFMAVMGGMAMVLYSGAIALHTLFDVGIVQGVWLIGLVAGGYTIYGGLKAVVWADLFNGIALLLGGLLVLILGMQAVGGIDEFVANSDGKLHTILPWDHPEVPWPAVFFGGLWIPNIVFWGLYQFIMQRTLGAKSLAEGQKGVLFAAFLKLLIPFIVIFPGIMAFELFGDSIARPDMAYPMILREILPVGFRGLMFAALFGAIISSLDSLFNSTSTILTMDIYKRHINKDASPKHLMRVGRLITFVVVISACLWTPVMKDVKSIFMTIQELSGLFSPGICAAFLFGLFWSKTPPIGANGALLMSVPVYGLLFLLIPEVAFLHRLWFTFLILSVYIIVVTLWRPLEKPVVMPKSTLNMHSPRSVKIGGIVILIATALLYIIFW